MAQAHALAFHFTAGADCLKKSSSKQVQSFFQSSFQNRLILAQTYGKKGARLPKMIGFWSLEVLALQKAFSTYQVRQLRKRFYVPASAQTHLCGKAGPDFLYAYLKEGLSAVPYLKYFFVYGALRNLKIEPLSSVDCFQSETRVFYGMGPTYLTLQTPGALASIWLSLYKILL